MPKLIVCRMSESSEKRRSRTDMISLGKCGEQVGSAQRQIADIGGNMKLLNFCSMLFFTTVVGCASGLELGYKDEVMEKIFHKNAERMLGL